MSQQRKITLYLPLNQPSQREMLGVHRSLPNDIKSQARQQQHPLNLLTRLLALCKRYVLPHQTPERELLNWFGYGHSPGLPVAQVTGRWDGLGDHLFWLRADPVLWQPGSEGGFMDVSVSQTLTRHQAYQLGANINELLEGNGMELLTPCPHRWYIGSAQPFAISTYSPTEVDGQEISAYLPYGPHASRWRAWLTEVQMLLEQNSLNAYRIYEGKPPINSLWLWGEGRLKPGDAIPNYSVISNDSLAQGLADLQGCVYRDMPTSYQSLNETLNWQHLMVVMQPQDDSFWQNWLQNWLKPIMAQLQNGHIKHLSIYCGGDERYELRGHWWNRYRIARYCQ